MEVKPPSETLHRLEISEGTTAADDNAEEPRQRAYPSTPISSHSLFLSSSEARQLPIPLVRTCLNRLDTLSLTRLQLRTGHFWSSI
jgi:hypothetical protein